MAFVTLTHLWIHLDSDRSQYVRFDGFTTEGETSERLGRLWEGAGGNSRIIRRPNKRVTLNLAFPSVPREDALQVKSWEGEVVLLRDPRGRKMWGTFFAVTIDERHGPLNPNVSFTFQQLTKYREAVNV